MIRSPEDFLLSCADDMRYSEEHRDQLRAMARDLHNKNIAEYERQQSAGDKAVAFARLVNIVAWGAWALVAIGTVILSWVFT